MTSGTTPPLERFADEGVGRPSLPSLLLSTHNQQIKAVTRW
jgi:hypothetical protein